MKATAVVGALVCALRNPQTYRSVSAFAPIAASMQCPWGKKALGVRIEFDFMRSAAAVLPQRNNRRRRIFCGRLGPNHAVGSDGKHRRAWIVR